MHELSEVVAISAGYKFALALLKDGEVMAWGSNESGQLGDGTQTSNDTPVVVSELGDVTAIAAGAEFGVALLNTGSVAAWGNNSFGELGVGTNLGPTTCEEHVACSETPVSVAELSEATAISADDTHSLALLHNGTVKTWGQVQAHAECSPNDEPDLGAFLCTTAPTLVPALEGVEAISAAPRESKDLALLKGGAVETWELESDHPPLTQVAGVENVVDISAGSEFYLTMGPPIPVVTAVTPASGTTAGGTPVTISGRNFVAVAAVMFGSVPASSFVVESADAIKAVSPVKGPGTTSITVTTAGGRSATTPSDRFTFVPEGPLEFGTCAKVSSGKDGTGRYSKSACTATLEGGDFEWFPGVLWRDFSSADATVEKDRVVEPKEVVLETVGNSEVVCHDESGSGEYLGTKEIASFTIKLTGCEFEGAKCSSTGAGAGEVVTSPLDGALGWIEREDDEVGVALSPASEGNMIEAMCGSTALTVRGAVIAEISPVDNMSASLKVKMTETKGEQEPEHFDGEGNDVLEVRLSTVDFDVFVKAGLKLDTTEAGEEEVEVNTVV